MQDETKLSFVNQEEATGCLENESCYGIRLLEQLTRLEEEGGIFEEAQTFESPQNVYAFTTKSSPCTAYANIHKSVHREHRKMEQNQYVAQLTHETTSDMKIPWIPGSEGRNQ